MKKRNRRFGMLNVSLGIVIFIDIVFFIVLIGAIYLIICRPDLTGISASLPNTTSEPGIPYPNARDSILALSSLAMVFATGVLAFSTILLAKANEDLHKIDTNNMNLIKIKEWAIELYEFETNNVNENGIIIDKDKFPMMTAKNKYIAKLVEKDFNKELSELVNEVVEIFTINKYLAFINDDKILKRYFGNNLPEYLRVIGNEYETEAKRVPKRISTHKDTLDLINDLLIQIAELNSNL